MKKLVLVMICLFVVGCTTQPNTPADGSDNTNSVGEYVDPTAAICAADASSPACICSTYGESSPHCACAQSSNLEICTRCSQASATKLRVEAQIQLAKGQYQDGDFLLRCALAKRQNDKIALLLVNQLEAPHAFFENTAGNGSHPYVVKSGDTLGSIAKNCLGNALYFVGLAQINNISDPSNLVAGQSINVPGDLRCDAQTTAVISKPIVQQPQTPVATPEKLKPVEPEPVPQQPIEPQPASVQPTNPATIALPANNPEIETLLEEFSVLAIEGDLVKACEKIDAILSIDQYNEDALLNSSSFCQ